MTKYYLKKLWKLFVKNYSLKPSTSRSVKLTLLPSSLLREPPYTKWVKIIVLHNSKIVLLWLTSLQIHSLFSILTLSHAYVTSIGRLIGVVTLTDVSLILILAFQSCIVQWGFYAKIKFIFMRQNVPNIHCFNIFVSFSWQRLSRARSSPLYRSVSVPVPLN